MAGKAKSDGVADFWAAVDALTYREMLEVAGLIGLTLSDRGQDLDGLTNPETLAKAMDSASEAYSSADD